MSFLYPLGLLGLLGIPVLIIIYIIKSKYTEQTVSSTYLWILSEKFLKRRNPLNRLTGIISLILQILAVTAISLAIAHPMITIPDSANDYFFILDGSGSMRMEYGLDEEGNTLTRFEEGKAQIAETIDKAVDGSIFSLVYAGDNTTLVFDSIDNKEDALFLLSELEPAFGAIPLTTAVGDAQAHFTENPSSLVYLVTDRYYETNNNMTLLHVGGDVENYAVSGLTYTYVDKLLTVNGYVTSYMSDTTLTTELYVNGNADPITMGVVVVAQGKDTPFQLTARVDQFTDLRVHIAEEDAFAYDNSQEIFDIESENSYNTLIVSEAPFFIQSMLDALLNARMDVITPEEYTGQRGYGLYVFDGFTPDAMPADGAVWLFNQTASLEDSGFSVQGELTFNKGELLELSTSTASSLKTLVQDMSGDQVYVSRLMKYGLYRNFYTIMSYQGNPAIFAGTNALGNREVVFAFDLRSSNLPLLYDFTVLMRNLVNYSFPEIMETSSYYCGDEITVNVPANCESIRVDAPSGDSSYISTESATAYFVPTEVGVYTVTMNVSNTQRQFKMYAAVNEEERLPVVAELELSLQGEATPGGFDGKYDALLAVFIALALIFVADWMVYCYEKYQLR
ncbi:MAG: BatA and WFA domain-containing protein [Clostridia bacterium]|nr:BatA and WFA domain-containing protein [Clostridia bacterium]